MQRLLSFFFKIGAENEFSLLEKMSSNKINENFALNYNIPFKDLNFNETILARYVKLRG